MKNAKRLRSIFFAILFFSFLTNIQVCAMDEEEGVEMEEDLGHYFESRHDIGHAYLDLSFAEIDDDELGGILLSLMLFVAKNRVEVLNLDNNLLTKLPSDFLKLFIDSFWLKTLYLRRNRILPDESGQIIETQVLNASKEFQFSLENTIEEINQDDFTQKIIRKRIILDDNLPHVVILSTQKDSEKYSQRFRKFLVGGLLVAGGIFVGALPYLITLLINGSSQGTCDMDALTKMMQTCHLSCNGTLTFFG